MKAARAIACLLALPGCIGRGIPYEGGEADEPVAPGDGYALEGTARDVETGEAPPEGLCASAIDPAPAVSGGDPVVLATAPAADGMFSVGGITDNPSLGVFLGIDDCADSGADVVINAATGIAVEEIAGKGTGDVVGGIDAVFVTHELEGRWAADLGWPGELGADGFLAGFVVDATGAPVSGASVDCQGCADDYYLDGNPSDGLFGDGTTFNDTTDAAADALFFIPAAPIFNYTCSDGGAHTWNPTLFGSVPGIGAFIQFDAL
jgi:hypothetical protein